MTDYRTLVYEKLGAVTRITANRPQVLNAQSRVMILELDEAFRRVADDAETRVAIVAGAGKHFSAGHDLGSAEELEDQAGTRSPRRRSPSPSASRSRTPSRSGSPRHR